MNNDKDLFHQALQRQNERSAMMKMPDDMEQRVMEHIETHGEKPKCNILLLALRAVASTAAAILIGLFLHVYEPTQKNSNDHSYYTTNWTGGSTLKNVYISNLRPNQKSFSYIQLKKKLYEKN
ncbi:MAG: hypothetical protein J5545_05810 [Bacteroidaceae bacterium]|nr:hypothetical protein [Bacteroidaceae bacterium]